MIFFFHIFFIMLAALPTVPLGVLQLLAHVVRLGLPVQHHLHHQYSSARRGGGAQNQFYIFSWKITHFALYFIQNNTKLHHLKQRGTIQQMSI